MKVSIKSFDVKMDVKNNGIEFEVYDTNDVFWGDCIVSRTGLTWCKGRTARKNGRKMTWLEFAKHMEKAE